MRQAVRMNQTVARVMERNQVETGPVCRDPVQGQGAVSQTLVRTLETADRPHHNTFWMNRLQILLGGARWG
jgi:hypothetical protein